MSTPSTYSYMIDVPIFGVYDDPSQLWRLGAAGDWAHFSPFDWAWHGLTDVAAVQHQGLPVRADAVARMTADRPRWVRYFGVATSSSPAAGDLPVAVIRERRSPVETRTERYSGEENWAECPPVKGAIADLDGIGPGHHLFELTAASAAGLLHATWGDEPFADLSPWTADEQWASYQFHTAEDDDYYLDDVTYTSLWREGPHGWEWYSPISWDWRLAIAELHVEVPSDLTPISPAEALVHTVDEEEWFHYCAVYDESAPPPDGTPRGVIRMRRDARNEFTERFTPKGIWTQTNARFRASDPRDDNPPILVPVDADAARTILVESHGSAAAAHFPHVPTEIGWIG